jgi:hypothetical protein
MTSRRFSTTNGIRVVVGTGVCRPNDHQSRRRSNWICRGAMACATESLDAVARRPHPVDAGQVTERLVYRQKMSLSTIRRPDAPKRVGRCRRADETNRATFAVGAEWPRVFSKR